MDTARLTCSGCGREIYLSQYSLAWGCLDCGTTTVALQTRNEATGSWDVPGTPGTLPEQLQALDALCLERYKTCESVNRERLTAEQALFQARSEHEEATFAYNKVCDRHKQAQRLARELHLFLIAPAKS